MNLFRFLTHQRSSELSLDDWAEFFTFNGVQFPVLHPSGTLGQKQEEIAPNFLGLVRSAYKSNGVVFSLMLVRLLVFSEARFQFRQMRSGRPGELFGTRELELLERPWPGGTTGDLLARAIQDVDLAGNFFAVRRQGGVKRLRPDWVTIMRGSQADPDLERGEVDAEVVGYIYHPGGRGSDNRPIGFLPGEIAHFAPIPDPEAQFRGMSWLTPVIREIMADKAATQQKLGFFEKGATPNLAVVLDKDVNKESFQEWIEEFEAQHTGTLNAFRTLYLGAGADVKTIGSDMRRMDFKNVQAGGETRIASAAGVPPIVAGLSEGLASATYSNYAQARRAFADQTMRPLWRNIAGSLATIIDVPDGAELWYDDRDVPFLQEDVKDDAEIQSTQAQSIRSLVEAGYDADSVIDAVTSGDLTRLQGQHSGLFSVQLQPAGTGQQNSNGVGDEAEAGDLLMNLLERRSER